MDINLDERSKKILQAIVQNYIKTAQPVGSRNIARHYKLGISPATIRNVMNDLEELGLIMQPHTSAGRIPTHKGYRYYVDTLMDRSKLTKQEEEEIQKNYTIEKINEFSNEIFHLTSKLLSESSNCTGVAVSPSISKSIIKRIEFISVSLKKVLIVLITNSNVIRNKIIEISSDISSDELHNISNILTDKLYGLTLFQIREVFINLINNEMSKSHYVELLKSASIFVKNTLDKEYENDIFLEGTANILQHPEFSEINKTKEILKILEEKKNLIKICDKINGTNGVKVFIGEETNILEMQDCSIVICTYKIEGFPSGTIGIIGPTRMKYGKIFSIVEFTSFQLEKALNNIIKNQ
ncbi:MAG: heat-inducible transcription repressor HrcA [Candidatus Firestonebacteria bacterium]|nr:heat-inducible transcription repressor HrcA [Candidatus Firestonebacteria bacterium]